MKKITLKQAIKNQTDCIELSASQLDDLMQIQISTNAKIFESESKGQPSKTFTKFYAAVATILITIAIGFIFSIPNTPIAEEIALEVSGNHLKLKPLEVKSGQLEDLDSYFTQLDFKLVTTGILKNTNWTLLGARYCTIQGHTAAQLRLKNKTTGATETLYQSPYYHDQFSSLPILENNQKPIESFARGVSVKIWVEKGVLFALTNNSAQN